MKCGRLFLTFLFIHACQFDFASSQSICLENGNYTTDSPYSVNLNRTLQSLEVNVDDNGFYNTWEGEGQDRANAMVLCRGDAQLEKCKNCTRVAAEVLLRACPLMKQAILWDELCMVRYSNETIDGVLMYAPVKFWRRAYNATSPDQFKEDARGLMDQLSEKAAAGDSLRKVAAGNVSVAGPDFQRIFALLQCTPDLSHADCSRCLVNVIRIIPDRCDGKRGCRVLCPSCNLRFEIYSFYDEERLLELEPTTVSLQPPSQASGNSDRRRLTIPTVIIIVVLAVLSLLLAVSAITVWFRKRRNQKPKENHLDTVDEMSTSESVQYDFSTIKAATDDFSYDNKLGQGGFGSVYKGKLPNGREIAVKRLSIDSGQGDLEFKNEVVLLAKLQHRNLVRLFGFAIQGVEKLLIYELVQNGSLDQLLFGGNRSYLDWDICYKIIGSIARGILYLHEDSRLRIIHRDLKASNILLDEEMNPKIADFGMAKLFGQDETHASTSRIVGTYGYMPPEYLKHGKFSIKSDVFSFGVLLLEIISGRRNNNPRSGESTQDLLEFAWKNWREGRAANVVDSSLRSNLDSNSMVEMVRCIHIGLLCVQENAGERPTMSSVVVMLSSSSIDMTLPSQPAFLFSSHVYDSDISRPSEKSERSSHNVDSDIELHPR